MEAFLTRARESMDGGSHGKVDSPASATTNTDSFQIRLDMTYCCAGLMTMAVEGAKQLAEDERLQVLGYELRDVHFQQPLMIPPEEEGVEVLMQFRSSVPDASSSEPIMHEFVIDSLAPGQKVWRRNCAGRVVTHIQVVEESTSRSDGHYRQRYDEISAACEHDTSPDAFYLELTGLGMAFGPTLRNLTRISSSNGKASCNIQIPNTAVTMPENWEYPHAIHPTLLESLTHVMIPALTGPKLALKETFVPKCVESVYISSNMIAKPGDELQGYATAKWHNDSLAEGDIVVLDSQHNDPLVVITQLQYKALPQWDVGANEWQPTIETSTKFRKLCSQISWDIDPESFRPSETVDLARYLECLFHKSPSLKILQVGGDPADVTSALLRVATANGCRSPSFSSLVYTAASAKEIADAGVVLAQWSTHVQFEILNIDEDLSEQGFEPAMNDLIIADATLQTPGRMKQFMLQIRGLMKPKGTLLIEGDATKLVDTDSSTFGFASLNLGKSIVHPTIVETWKTLMTRHGFASGPVLCKDSTEQDIGQTQLIVAANAGSGSVKSQICGEALIIRPSYADQHLSSLITNMVGRLAAMGYNTAVVDMYTAVERTIESCLVINMVEINEPVLSKLGPTEFEAIKSLVLRSKALLWVTMGGVMMGESPEVNVVSGFARTMRLENDSPNFATLDLGSLAQINQTTVYNDYADAFGKIALLLCEEDPEPSFEREFAYHDRHLYVPRVGPLKDMNIWMNEPHAQLRPEKVCLNQIGSPIQLAWAAQGEVGDLHFKEDLATSDLIGDNHVQIDVKASALNMTDLVSSTENMGFECAGVITELGKKVRHLRKGDKVMTIGPGCHRTTALVSEDLCQRIPQDISYQQGASMPLAYCTAYLALVTSANVKPGESVLIDECPDGLDQAAAAFALHLGAQVFILVSSPERRLYMREQLHIPESHILAIDNLELPRSLMRLTANKGIDVVVGYSQGEIMRQSWNCISQFGRFVNLHTSGGPENTTELDMRPFKRSATFSSVDIITLLQCHPDEVSRIFRDVRCLLDQGVISPISQLNSYDYSRVSECFETLRAGKNRGKTVLSAHNGDVVPVCRLGRYWLNIIDQCYSLYVLPQSRSGSARILRTSYPGVSAASEEALRSGLSSMARNRLFSSPDQELTAQMRLLS